MDLSNAEKTLSELEIINFSNDFNFFASGEEPDIKSVYKKFICSDFKFFKFSSFQEKFY